MDMDKLNRVCAMYAAGQTVKVIASDVGVSSNTIWLYLQRAREMGDVRARHRRVRGDAVVKVLADSFEAADGVFWVGMIFGCCCGLVVMCRRRGVLW